MKRDQISYQSLNLASRTLFLCSDGLKVCMCWAKDDPKVAYRLFAQQYIDAGAKIVGPQSGGHANFLEFDDDAKEFLLGLSYTCESR